MYITCIFVVFYNYLSVNLNVKLLYTLHPKIVARYVTVNININKILIC